MSLVILIIATLMYIFMIIINGLANTLPLNGISTGAVSFKYPNLFQPSGVTFSIWGIIYILLFAYLVYQYSLLGKDINIETKQIYDKINLLFGLTSLLNGLWLFAWHYDRMILSSIIIIFLLITLILIAKIGSELDVLTKSTFSIYLGWITIATIANVTITLVKYGLPGFNQSAVLLTVFILFIGMMISILWIIREKDIAFGGVIVWAYLGIIIRQLSRNELNQEYPLVYISAIICLVFVIAANIWILLGRFST